MMWPFQSKTVLFTRLRLSFIFFALLSVSGVALAQSSVTGAAPGTWTTTASGCKVWNPYPIADESVEWSGACAGGYASGQGALRWFKKGVVSSITKGIAVEGRLSGEVEINYSSGAKYVGRFKDDKKEGQGTLIFADGSKYVGRWMANKREGQGVLTYADGTKYVGEWVADKPEGKGTYTFANGDKYVGGWKGGLLEGQGTRIFANGDKYVGGFKGGLPEGQGIRIFADGDKYVGGFKADQRDGQGTYTFASGDKYVGGWSGGKQEGEGTYIFANGDKYVGGWSGGKREGEGTLTFAKGNTYQGMFARGVFSGPGVLTYRGGGSFDGEWLDGKRNGFGTEYSNEGQISRQGFWVNDTFSRASNTPPPLPRVSNAKNPITGLGQVRLVNDGGVYKIPVLINDSISLNFVLDSGAADVSIPWDVISVMIRAGDLNESDFLGKKRYVLADGSIKTSETFIIKKLTVGNVTLTNILGSSTDISGHLLLGQSFLSKLAEWKIDNTNKILFLRPNI